MIQWFSNGKHCGMVAFEDGSHIFLHDDENTNNNNNIFVFGVSETSSF